MLDELNSGFLDGYTYGDVKSVFPEEYEQRKKDKLRYRYPGGDWISFVSAQPTPLTLKFCLAAQTDPTSD
jgi:broad specificity phosphatase PhoE